MSVTAWRTSCLYGVSYSRASPRLFDDGTSSVSGIDRTSPRCECGWVAILSPYGILCACAVPEWYNHQAIFAGFETIFYKNFGNSKILFTFVVSFCACGVMVAALDLGSNVSGRGGSSPFMRTRIKEKFPVGFFSFFVCILNQRVRLV